VSVAGGLGLIVAGALILACALPVINDWRGVASRTYAMYKRLPLIGRMYRFPLFHFGMVAPFVVLGLFSILAGCVLLARS
jgi:hypothetical protein